jgi:hypothetical protein
LYLHLLDRPVLWRDGNPGHINIILKLQGRWRPKGIIELLRCGGIHCGRLPNILGINLGKLIHVLPAVQIHHWLD